MSDLVDFIYLGPPKTIYYGRGTQWYMDTQFPQNHEGRLRIDCGPTYAYNPLALERIHKHNPKMKLSIGLRNPIERAFSHYWHVKKKSLVSLNFDQSLEDYTAFWAWMKTSMVSYGLKKSFALFGRENVHVMMFDDIKKSPETTLNDVFGFLDIDQNFVPSARDKKINVAGPKHSLAQRTTYKLAKSVLGEDTLMKKAAHNPFFAKISGKNEYVRGVDPEFEAILQEIFEPEISALETLLDIDLNHWRSHT